MIPAGILILLIGAGLAYWLSHGSVAVMLLVLCFLLVILPPEMDPAIRWKEKRERPKPVCFGDWPHYHGQTAAERCCHDCPFAHECFEDTPYAPRA